MTSRMATNRLFIVIAFVITFLCLQVKENDDYELWHCRYEHLSYKGLNTLPQKNTVRGLPNFKESDKLREDCMIRKHHRDPIPKQSTCRATKRLELINADICGLIMLEVNTR